MPRESNVLWVCKAMVYFSEIILHMLPFQGVKNGAVERFTQGVAIGLVISCPFRTRKQQTQKSTYMQDEVDCVMMFYRVLSGLNRECCVNIRMRMLTHPCGGLIING